MADDARRGAPYLTLQNRRTDFTRRQMDETRQFFAVQDHPAPAGLAEQHISNMLLMRICLVFERYEVVALRVAEYPQCPRYVAADLQRSVELSRLDRKANDGGEERMGYLGSGSVREFWHVDEERFAVFMGY